MSGVALALLALVATYLVAVRTSRGQSLDLTAMRGRAVQSRRLIGAAGGLLGTVSVASLGLVMLVLTGVAIVRRRPRVALVAAVVVGGSIVTTELLKYVVLARPALMVLANGEDPANTLPSGHSTIAMAVVIAMILVLPRRAQGMAALVGAPYAVGIGLATVLAGWHRPSDVVAAAFVVAAWTFAGILALGRVGAMWPERRSPWERVIVPGIVVLMLGTVAVLAATTLIGLTVNFHRVSDYGRRGALRPAVAFGFSAASIVAVAMTVIGSVLWVLRDVRLDR